MNFVYFHGFNSAFDTTNPKIVELETIGNVTGVTYDSYATFDEIFEYFKEVLPRDFDTVYVGTSLGGYWAATMAKFFGLPSVIINPCYDPSELLQKYSNKSFLNYVTGNYRTFDAEVPKTYADHPLLGNDESFQYKPLLLVDLEDEVIDSEETLLILRGFPAIAYEGGSHRFDHMQESLNEIKTYANNCSYIENINT